MPASLGRANSKELDINLHVLSGKMPTDILGHGFIISAIPLGDGSPVFNGDGMVYRLDFEDNKLAFRSRLMRTPCYYADQATMGEEAGFRTVAMARVSSILGARNQVNTAFLPMGKRLMATFDAGRPYEIDPVSLELATPMGWNREWTGALPDNLTVINGPFKLIMTSAHPYYDEHTGEVFSVNYGGDLVGGTPFVHVVRWRGDGPVELHTLVSPEGAGLGIRQTAHQFAVTRDYVILMDTAFYAEGEQLFDPEKSKPQSPDCVLYILARRDLKTGGGKVTARKVVLEREAAHFLADYDNPDGKITLHMGHIPATDPSEWLRASDTLVGGGSPRREILGVMGAGMDINTMGRHVIDGESGKVLESLHLTDEDWTWGVALYTHRDFQPGPRMENLYWLCAGQTPETLTQRLWDMYAKYPYRKIPVERMKDIRQPASIVRLDAREMKIADGYRFPAGRAGLSPLFAPKRGAAASNQGYIMMVMVSDDKSNPKSSGDELWIFDAANLAQGPLCRLGHPDFDMTFSLHTAWMPPVQKRDHGYHIPVREDYADRVAKLDPALQKVFEDKVFPHFDRK
ncbi:MAG: hypothetical protein GMKNLPBB_00964 [Myxococcota bacterium]|nr:hypothetical protein [Myxococcota bacterium]